MARPTDTDWITEGVKVAELDRRHMDYHASFTAVAKLTKTQIVCDNGNRYRRDTLMPVGGGRIELCRPDDPRVRNAIARRALERLRFNVDDLCKDHRGDADDVLATLVEIEKAVASARVSIEDVTAARVAEDG